MRDQAEKTILHYLMDTNNSHEQRMEVFTQIHQGLFHDKNNLAMYQAITELIAEKEEIDSIGVYRKSKRHLQMDYSDMASVRNAILLLTFENYKSELRTIAGNFLKEVSPVNDFDQLTEMRNKTLMELTNLEIGTNSKPDIPTFQELSDELFSRMNKDENELIGYQTGIRKLDLLIDGLQQGRMNIVSGLKKSGKSRFALSLLNQLAIQRQKSIFISLEMNSLDCIRILYSAHYQIDESRLRNKRLLSSEQWEKLHSKNINQFSEYFDFDVSPSLTPEKLLNRLRLYGKLGYKFVFIDFLQRINFPMKNLVNEISQLVNRIADTARELNIGVILLAQLTNSAEHEGTPHIGHLRGASAITESADSILILDNKYRKSKNESDKNKLIVDLTQRHGESARFQIGCDLSQSRFFEIAEGDYSDSETERDSRYSDYRKMRGKVNSHPMNN